MNVTNTVRTVFSATAAPFTGPVSKLAAVAGTARSAIGAVTSMISPLTLALGALGGAGVVSQISAINGAFENTNLQIGGMLTAIGRTSDMTQGLEASAEVMEAIRVSAAALPGEAEDYITVFQGGLVTLDRAIGGTLRQQMEFSNRFTAITSMWHIDSAQAAADMSRMLQAGRGGAGMDVQTFTKMLPYMRQSAEYANITAETFNAMPLEERAALLQTTMGRLQPMLDASGRTWDALTGTAMSNVREMFRVASAPVFDRMKDALERFNNLLYDGQGNIQPLARKIVAIGYVVGTTVVKGFEKAFEAAGMILGVVDRIGGALENSPGLIFLGHVFSNVQNAFGVLREGIEQAFSGADGGMNGVLGSLSQSFSGLMAVLDVVSSALSIAVSMVVMPFQQLVDIIVGFLPGALEGMASLFSGLFELAGALQSIYMVIWTAVRPAFQAIYKALGDLFRVVGAIVGVTFRLLAMGLMMLWSKIKDYVVPVLSWFGEKLGSMLTALVGVLTRLKNWIMSMIPASARGSSGSSSSSGQNSFIDDLRAQFAEAMHDSGGGSGGFLDQLREGAAGAAPPTAPGGRPGGHTVNDFRNSRFTIEQRFEEGFDPDRIATAFSQDLSRVADARLQSGYEPMFAVR